MLNVTRSVKTINPFIKNYLYQWIIDVDCDGVLYTCYIESPYEPSEDDIMLYLLGIYHFDEDQTLYAKRMTDAFGEYTEEMAIDFNDMVLWKIELERIVGKAFMDEMTRMCMEFGIW